MTDLRGPFEWGPLRPLFRPLGLDDLFGGEGDRFLGVDEARAGDPAASRLELLLDWESLLGPP